MGSTPVRKGGKPGERRYGDGRAAFLGHLEAIQQWVGAGKTMRTYYDAHAKELGISYPQFTRHAESYVEKPKKRSKLNERPEVRNGPAVVERQPAERQPVGAIGPPAVRDGDFAPRFHHDPKPKKDLIG